MTVRGDQRGMLGFQELNLGRGAYAAWHSQASLDAWYDPHDDLAGLGGTPWEEQPWEDGVEAPLRGRLRSPQSEWQPEPQPLPSPELMTAWADSELPTLDDVTLQMDALRQREQERARLEEEVRQRNHAAQVARIKRARARRVRLRPAPAPTPRQRFVSMEQLAAFLGED